MAKRSSKQAVESTSSQWDALYGAWMSARRNGHRDRAAELEKELRAWNVAQGFAEGCCLV